MNPNDKYLKVAIGAAKKAAPLFKKYFGRPKKVRMKNGDPRDLVTEIDRRIERVIKQEILKSFPDHAIKGEEYGLFFPSSAVKGKGGGGQKFRWFIDPIDGTGNYIQGLAFCCISVGLWDEKGPLCAIVYEPINNLMYSAQRYHGAFLNGKKLKVSKTKNLAQAVGGIGWLEAKNGIKLFSQLVKTCRKIRALASSTLQICLVAQGVLDFYVTRDIHVWDFAAAILFVSEARGKISNIQGTKISEDSLSLAVSNGKIHKELLSQLKNR